MAMTFMLASPSFSGGGDIPATFTCDGEGIPPHLIWTGAPKQAESFVLIMDDPDVPSTFTHWVVFDIPAESNDLPSGTRSDAVGLAGRNSGGTLGYMGPCPPSGMHRYVFRLFALDVKTLGLIAGASRERVEDAIAGHMIGTAELIGRYGR